MDKKIDQDTVYKLSEDVIFKKIEGQFVIVPLIAGVGNLEEEMFQLNNTGSAFWNMIDGKKSLIDIITLLCKEYDAPLEDIKKDVLTLGQVLLEKRFIVPADTE